jgi:hypothetical protein
MVMTVPQVIRRCRRRSQVRAIPHRVRDIRPRRRVATTRPQRLVWAARPSRLEPPIRLP